MRLIFKSWVVVVSRMAWYTTGDQSCERVDTMVTMRITCRHCGSPDLTKYGIAPNGKQKYRCRTCGRQSRENPGSASYAPERKEEILRAYQERRSLRGLERTFGVARSTVISWLKQKPRVARRSEQPSSILIHVRHMRT